MPITKKLLKSKIKYECFFDEKSIPFHEQFPHSSYINMVAIAYGTISEMRTTQRQKIDSLE
jgi:hypothetical protein